MIIKILRQQAPGAQPYWEEFAYDGSPDISVAALLDVLNYRDDITDVNGKKTTRIQWECSCLQGVCGACAMVINGTPALACETILKDLKKKKVTIRPLQKFPVIRDLVTDRSVIQEGLVQTNTYIGEYCPDEKEDHTHQYLAAKYLKCGLCLEVCPNYVNGKHFYGALFANECYLVSARNRQKADQIHTVYASHFAKDCSKSLSCQEVCPVGIPAIASMGKLNRRRKKKGGGL